MTRARFHRRFVESSPIGCWEFIRSLSKVARSSSEGDRELAGRMSGVYRKVIGSSPEECREFVERLIDVSDNED
ncbi:hypothetical protein BHE74_00036560 [Ensete ventricosum]|nr:hypothetical protein BHE74_00036560 [Ensete ventricosum]